MLDFIAEVAAENVLRTTVSSSMRCQGAGQTILPPALATC